MICANSIVTDTKIEIDTLQKKKKNRNWYVTWANIFLYLKSIFITHPASAASAKHFSSTQRRLKTYFRKTVQQVQMLLSVHQNGFLWTPKKWLMYFLDCHGDVDLLIQYFFYNFYKFIICFLYNYIWQFS